ADKRRLFEEVLLNHRDLVAPDFTALLDLRLCLEAHLDASLRSIQEYGGRGAKATAPKPKKLKAKAGAGQRTSSQRRKSSSSTQTRPSTSRRLTRATVRSSQLAKARTENTAVEMEQQVALPPSGGDLGVEVGQENVEPPASVMGQVEGTEPLDVTPMAPRQSQVQRTPLQTRSQTRLQQNGEREAQLSAPGTPKGQQMAVPKAMRALQLNSPAKHSPARTRQLFSPYAKCSVQEKARAFEEKLAQPTPAARTPSKATPKAAAIRVATPKTFTRKALKPSPPVSIRVTRSSSASSSTLTSGGDDSDWMESPEKLALPLRKPKTAPRSGAKVAVALLLSGKTTSTASVKVPPVLKPVPSLVPLTKPSTGHSRAGPSSRASPEPSRKRFHSRSPEPSHKRPSANIPDSEKKRKEELMRAKAEATKMERERRLALVQAAREKNEAKKREADLMREQKEHEREQERLRKRAAFHQRKQSDRNLEVSVLTAAHKRKADSPAFSHAPKLLAPAPKNPRTQGKPDAEAARLIFGQPNTSLSQKAKLNQSLQQQAMLNSLNMTLKSQASAEEADLSKAQEDDCMPCAAANSTFTVETSCPETPVQTGAKKKSTSYDITPHHTELPPEPNKQPENYDIDDLDSGDETDDDDQPRKEVPTWAKSSILNGMIREQHWMRPHGEAMFGRIPDLDLGKVFTVPKKYFYKRTSSAVWDKMHHEQSFSGAA
ncbi:unnamed protein product, partial [Ixodes hexagonus]